MGLKRTERNCDRLMCKAHRTLAAIQDTAASVGAKRQHRQSDRCMLSTSALANEQHTRSSSPFAVTYMAKFRDMRARRQNGFIQRVFR